MNKKRIIHLLFISLLCIGHNSANAQSWTEVSNYPGLGNYDAFSFTINGKGYVGTGAGMACATQQFWEYDPANDQWTMKANFPGYARVGAAGFAIDGKGYAGMGSAVGSGYKDFYEYDPITDEWTQLADYPGQGWAFLSSFIIGNKAYVGNGQMDTLPYLTNDFYMYDPSLNSWTQKSDVGTYGRSHSTSFALNGKGYIGTGTVSTWYGGSTSGEDFWEYDPSTDSWAQLNDFPCGLVGAWDLKSFIIDSTVYACGGYYYDHSFNQYFWKYNDTLDSWSEVMLLPGVLRCGHEAFTIDSTGYFGLGLNGGSYLTDLWKFSLDPNIATNSSVISSPKEEIQILKNPFYDNVLIRIPQFFNNNVWIEIKNSIGETVYSANSFVTAGSISIELKNLPSGAYVIHVGDAMQSQSCIAIKM